MHRFALLGAGFIGSVHATSLANHPRVDFVLVYDIDSARAERLAEQHGAQATDDLDGGVRPGPHRRRLHCLVHRHSRRPPAPRCRCRTCRSVREADRPRPGPRHRMPPAMPKAAAFPRWSTSTGVSTATTRKSNVLSTRVRSAMWSSFSSPVAARPCLRWITSQSPAGK